MAPLFAGGPDDRSRRSRWTDRIVGIVVGIALGLGVLAYFVFAQSEGTIDAPKVNGATTQAEPSAPAHPGSPEQHAGEGSANGKSGGAGEPAGGEGAEKAPRPIPVVEVVGGAPPTGAGPKQLHFKQGERVRFKIQTSEPFSFEIRGLGITKSIETTSVISFNATKAGQFPVIATATLIGVADLLISPKG